MKTLFLFLTFLIGMIAALPWAGVDLFAAEVGTLCPPAGGLESLLNLALLVGGAFVPGAAWMVQLSKGRKLAQAADGLSQVISRHDSADQTFLDIAQSGQLEQAALAIKDIIRSKEGA